MTQCCFASGSYLYIFSFYQLLVLARIKKISVKNQRYVPGETADNNNVKRYGLSMVLHLLITEVKSCQNLNMKRIITITIAIFLFEVGFPQEIDCNMMAYQIQIISRSGGELKVSPDNSSKTLIKVPYWSVVNGCLNYRRKDTINGTYGYWERVKYNGIEGFMFDGSFIRIDTSYAKLKKFRIMSEGFLCAPVNFDPRLNWYGIYKTHDGDSLEKVEIDIRKLNQSDDDHSGLDDGTIVIKTNISKTRRSLLLIGSEQELKEGFVRFGELSEFHSLYPGQTCDVGITEKNGRAINFLNGLKLNAIGTVEDIQFCPVLVNYRLRLTDIRNNYKTQDITDDFKIKGECGMPELFWYGDLDGDRRPDLIFTAGSTTTCQITLFLSCIADNDNFVKKADQWDSYNCY